MSKADIAIVGAGCRFPGAEDLEEFWRVLVNGENHVKDIPDSRWNTSAFYDEDKSAPGKIYVKKAGLLSDHDKWDNKLFGISDVEASRMDPQQRYVLECVHMALEDGGFTRQQISGSKTGVIIGCMNDDYKSMANSDLSDIGSYNATGTSTSVISARVSYVYNLHGTCLTLDTACSSAMMSVHLAAQAIQTGDCDMVICGGVNSILSPDTFKAPCEARMMSAIGQCQSFCDTADGYARGEGCGIVILKSLRAALEDRNKVWATIIVGCNQDGCTMKPMTAPSGDQQLELLKRVYKTYHFNPEDIQYIEAHGTGTPRGDPTELNALGTFFSSFRSKTADPLLVGSVKSNIGHTESAAGTAGLLKVILMMKKGFFVPSLHLKSDKSNLNPNIKLSEFGLEISSSVKEWPCRANGERNACLNSFGFGGSNTHVIIRQIKPCTPELKNINTDDILIPICISGIDKESLKVNLSQFHHDLADRTSPLFYMAQTSFHHRDIFQYRTLICGKNSQDMQGQCKTKLQQIDEISPHKKHNKIFVYCGVGTTWTGMCRELIQSNDAFRQAINRIDMYLEPLAGWKIEEKFVVNTSYDDPFLNHIAIFCCQVALTEVWRSFGIIPDTVIGQSVGEVAAAYSANLLTLKEAVNIIYHRSKVLARHCEGSMAVIGNVDIKEVEKMCSECGNDVSVAVYSSPAACTISGQTWALKRLTQRLQDEFYEKVFTRTLQVRCGYHSSLLDCCLDEIKKKVEKVFDANSTNTNGRKAVPMISTVTGKLVVDGEVKTGSYWAKNVRDPVLFMQSIKQAYDSQSLNIFLEIGPRPVLKAHLQNIFNQDRKARAIPSLLVGNELQCFYRSLTDLFESGLDIDYSKSDSFTGDNITCIPRYKFNKTGSLYLPPSITEYLSGFLPGNKNTHMFVEVSKRSGEISFAISIDEKSTPFVYDHFLFDDIVVPGAIYVETGFHVGMELLRKPVEKLSVAFDFVKTYTVSKGRYHKLSILLKSQRDNQIIFHVFGYNNLLAVGTVSERKGEQRGPFDIQHLKTHCPVYKSRTECYNSMKKFNFRYGESLSLIQRAWISNSRSKCLTEIHIPDDLLNNLSRTHFHPAVIDSVFQIFGILANDPQEDHKFSIPKGVDAVVFNKSIEKHMFCYVEEVKMNGNSSFYNAVLVSETGAVIAEMENYFTTTLTANSIEDNKSYNYTLNWSEALDILETKSSIPRNIVLYTHNMDSDWQHHLIKAAGIDTVSDAQSIIEEVSSVSENISLIVHVDTMNVKNKETDGTFILNSAVERFMEIKKLLALIKSNRNILSITFITENTQHCPGRDTINLVGSELWGMLRSAAHEGFNKDFKLVDVDRQKCDVKVLMKIISSTSINDREFAVSGSKLFRAIIQPGKIYESLKRPVVITSYDTCGIYSRKAMEVSEPYLMLSHDCFSKVDTKSVILESFSLHENVLLFPTAEIVNKSDFLLRNEDECQIIVVEGRGKLQTTGTSVSFIYPTNAMTVLDIPQEHLIADVDCPVYVSGILILANVLSQIALSIEKGTDVMVIKKSEEADIGQEMFTHLLNERHCKTLFTTLPGLKKETVYNNVKCLLVMTPLTIDEWETIPNSFPFLTTVISLNIFIQEELHMWLQYKFKGFDLIFLSIIEMQSVKKIRNALPCIKNCLRRIDSNKFFNKRIDFLFKLPMKELQVHQNIKDGSLKCFCNRDDIFRPNACYIIVGGLTGLGWELLQLMAEQGAGVLIPLSRRGPQTEQQQKIEELRQKYSCRILPMKADVSEYDSVKQVFTDINVSFPTQPIRGIFHGAGIAIDSALENLDRKNVFDVMKPKILGAWNLHLASLNVPLDFFVLHSSVVSVIGNPGQCNYSAANSFLDSFAYYRRLKGLVAQSINWGALSVGMAVENNYIKAKLKRNGFNILKREKIRESFLEAIVNDSTNIVYADIEWDKLLSIPTFSVQTLKFNEIKNLEIVSQNQSILDTINFGNLRELDMTGKTEVVRSAVREITYKVLVVEDGALTDKISFTDLGIDSMTAMSLSNALDELFHYRISVVTLLSEETTLGAVVETIVKNIEYTYKLERKHDTFVATDDSETQELFKSENITFMQKDLLTHYQEKRNDPYYLRIIDVDVFGTKLHVNDWKIILTHIFKMRPELRRKYHFSKNEDVLVQSVSESELNINITHIPVETLENTNVSEVRTSYDPDISDLLPFIFQVAESQNNTILRIVTHALITDMKGMSMLCRDIETTAIAYLHRKALPSEYSSIDMCGVIKRSIFPKLNKLAMFWDNYMNVNIAPITLGTNLQNVDASFCRLSRVNLPTRIVAQMKKYVAKQGISLYEFIMSLYQLYLHVGSKSFVVAVGTAVDMRFHVPELNNVLTRCANYIPVIAHINQTSTVTEFIQRNSQQISTATENGAYPSSLILKQVKSAVAREHIFRHFLVMNDMTEINKLTTEEHFINAEIRRIWHVRPDRETFIYVSYDLKKAWIKFEVGINEKICGQYGKLLTDKLLWLAQVAMTSGNRTIKEVRNQITILGAWTKTDSETKDVTFKNSSSNQTPNIFDFDEKPWKNTAESMAANLGAMVEKQLDRKCSHLDEKKDVPNADSFIIQFGNHQNFAEMDKDLKNQNITIISGYFEKQTTDGWDHDVRVTLSVCHDKRFMLEWSKEMHKGEERKRKFDLTKMKEAVLRTTNGVPTVTIFSSERKLILKTSDHKQAEQLVEQIERLLKTFGEDRKFSTEKSTNMK